MRTLPILFLIVFSSTRLIAGDEVEIDVGREPPNGANLVFDSPQGILADYYLYTAAGDTLAAWSSVESLEISGGALTVGSAKDQSGALLSLEMSGATVIFANNLDMINVVASQDTGGTPAGTSLSFDTLSMNYGGLLNIGDGGVGEDSRNRVEFRELVIGADGAQGGINLGKNAALSITAEGGTLITGFSVGSFLVEQFGINLSEGSVLSVKDGLTLEHARITGNGKIADSVRLDSQFTDMSGDTYATAEIIVSGGQTQQYGGNATVGETGGIISVVGDASGEAVMRIAGALEMDGSFAGSRIEVKGEAGNEGRIEAGNLRMANSGLVAVGEYGVLVIGDSAAPIRTEWLGGVVDVGTGGEAVFNNRLSLSMTAGVTAHDGGRIVFNDDIEMTEDANITLRRGGIADFSGNASGARLTGGSLSALEGDNVAAVGKTGLAAAAPATVRVDGAGTSLSLYESVSDASAGDANGVLNVAASEALALANGGKLLVGSLVIAASVGDAGGPAAIFTGMGGQSPDGAVSAGTFVVESGANVVGDAGIATTVEGGTLISGTYHVAGSDNNFLSGMEVDGSLVADGDATVNLGPSPDSVWLQLSGGKLDASPGSLTLRNVEPDATGVIAVLGEGNSVAGNIDAADFGLHVEGDLALSADTEFAVGSYRQTSGTVANAEENAGAGILVEQAAVIDGAGAVFAANANFDGGAVFSGGAVLAGAGNVVSSSDPGVGSIHVDSTAKLELVGGGLTIRNLKSVDIDGVFSLGYNPDAADGATHLLTLEGGVMVAFGEGASLELDDALIEHYYRQGDFADGGDDSDGRHWIIKGQVALPESYADGWVVSNAFGEFRFKYSDEGLWLDSYQSDASFNEAALGKRLRDKWGGLITDAFVANVAAVGRNRADSIANGGAGSAVGAYAKPGSFSGGLLYEMLYSVAVDRSDFTYTGDSGRTVSGAVDRGLISSLNGKTAYGPYLVSRGVALEAMSGIEDKLTNDRLLWSSVRHAVSSEYANGCSVMQARRPREFWARAMGLWQDSDRRRDVEGYRYRGSGLQLGYDNERDRMRYGAAFAYVAGKYRDKSATAHASDIDNYSFDLYAAYNHPDGYFATAVAGYTDSRNRLRERRGGNWDKANYDIGTLHGQARIGYDYRHTDQLTITPTVGIAYLNSRSDGYDWYYADTALMRYHDMSNNVTRVPLELSVAYDLDLEQFGKLDLNAKLGYARNIDQGKVRGTADLLGMVGVVPIDVAGRGSGRNEFSLGSGLAYHYREWELGLRYFYRHTGDYGSHTFSGSIGIHF